MQMREGEAPSYFNPMEATATVELIEGLLKQQVKAGPAAVTQDDIGVIATYRKQVGKCNAASVAVFTNTAYSCKWKMHQTIILADTLTLVSTCPLMARAC